MSITRLPRDQYPKEMVGSFYRIKIEKSQKLIHDGKN